MPDLQPPFVPGWDLAGDVTTVGRDVTGLRPGDRVLGMIRFGRIGGRVGAYAPAAAVDPGWLAPLSDAVDHVTAATLALNALTARQALDLIAAPTGATLLITGASGGVGGFAVQLAAREGVPLGPECTAALRDGGVAVFTRPPRPAEPERDVRFETVLVQSNAEQLRALTADLEAGRLRTRIAEVLPLAQAARAHELDEAGGLRGKVVLTP